MSKVKSDKTYKYVEDPKESQSKQKAVSTTPSRESNENEEDGEEESEEESAGIYTGCGTEDGNTFGCRVLSFSAAFLASEENRAN